MAKKKKDDLTKIEGIGPAAVKLLSKGGIKTFADLSNAKVSELREILGTKRYNPTTWARQAKLAANEDWDKLDNLQEKLDGGKPKKEAAKTKTTKTKTTKTKATKTKATEKRAPVWSLDQGSEKPVQQEMFERRTELNREKKKLEKIKDSIVDEIFNCTECVNLVKIDFKKKKGKLVRPLKYAICVGVEAKIHKDDLAPSSRIQTKYKGAITDVIESQISPASGPEELYNPLIGGAAISRQAQGARRAWGTLGIPVKVGGQKMYMTNQHVACDSGTEDIGGIVQPPLGSSPISLIKIGFDGKTGGRHHRTADVALIKPFPEANPRDSVTEILGLSGEKLEFSYEKEELEYGDIVFKVGAASGGLNFQEGMVTNTSSVVKVSEIRQAKFYEQIEVTSTFTHPIVQRGDSGSVLLKRGRNDQGMPVIKIVGLVFAKKNEFGDNMPSRVLYANHMENVRDSL